MQTLTQTADSNARVSLPREFANATVIIELVSDTELRIRKSDAPPEENARFSEEAPRVLSDRERDLFLSLLDNPPAPNDALKDAAEQYCRHG